MSNTSSNKDPKFSEVAFTFLTIILVVALVNGAFFFRNVGRKTAIKVDNIGDTVYLLYANQNETYSIEGIDGAVFSKVDQVFAFSDKNYRVSDEGQPYCIVNSKGATIGTVQLEKRDTVESIQYRIDIANLDSLLVTIPQNYESVYVYSSDPNYSWATLSIQIEKRYDPIDVIFDNVHLQAPDLAPVLYCVYDVDINMEIIGSVWLEGGNNPYTMQHVSEMENLFSTINVAANAYYVCMLSAVGTAGSIIYGIDYYANMFQGVTALQLNVMENAWGKVENLVNGQDGADGLDGVPAIQVAAGLNIIGDENASLTVMGGRGSDGGDATDALVNKNNGGNGGKGGSALVCGSLAVPFHGQLSLCSGDGGQGGAPGYTPLGDHGREGAVGGQLDPKVVLDREINLN